MLFEILREHLSYWHPNNGKRHKKMNEETGNDTRKLQERTKWEKESKPTSKMKNFSFNSKQDIETNKNQMLEIW